MIAGFFLLCAAVLFYSYFVEPNRLVITRHVLKIDKWDKNFDGLKIALISDVHGGSNGASAENLRRVVETTNNSEPDLIFLLGDFVSQTHGDENVLKMPLEEISANLGGLKAKYGVFGVLGNHDVWHDSNNVYQALSSAGITMLENEIAFIEKNGKKLKIIGLKDHLKITGWEELQAETTNLIKSSEPTDSVIILEHSPDVLAVFETDAFLRDEIDLVLAGHTHGGQAWFPVIGRPIVPSGYGQRYAYGHIKEEGMDMFVTSGIGTSILPFRFLVPPEISVIEIFAE